MLMHAADFVAEIEKTWFVAAEPGVFRQIGKYLLNGGNVAISSYSAMRSPEEIWQSIPDWYKVNGYPLSAVLKCLMKTKINTLAGKLLPLVLAAGILILIGHELELHLPGIEHWIENLGPWAPLGFIGLFVALTPFFVSVDALCFAAGLLFPIGAGEFYIIISTYLAAALIFVLSRYLFRQKVVGFIAKHPKIAALEAVLGDQSFKLMLLLRLTPLPFAMLSYAFSVAPVGFWPYLTATSGILVYNSTLVYIGYTTKHIAGLVSGSSAQTAVSFPLLVAGLLFTLAVLFYVSKLAGKTLKELHVMNGEELN
ncbi:MAG: VTT domain-containing protein [Methylobacter sp.]|nr:VTT domain-containing protein [Methylobacter sp.]